MKQKLAAIAVISTIVLVGFLWWRSASDDEPVSESRTAYGNVDIRDLSLGFRVGGRVQSVRVEEGDTVESGDELAQLDAAPYRAALAGAKAQLAGAQANLDRLEAGFRPEEIAQARANLADRAASMERARKNLARQRELYQADAGTLEALDLAESAYAEAKAREEVAAANLALIEAGFRREEIAQARASVQQAAARVEEIELQLADTQLKSPSRGTVITRAIEPGTIVQPGQPALTLSLQDHSWARAYVSESQLGLIHPGMPVEVHTDSRAEPYPGQIGFISPKAEFTPKNVETNELRSSLVYRFRVIIDEPDERLRQGMPVTVTWKALENDG